MTLEQQLSKLSELGFSLDAGITIDDLLFSYGREEFEREPFELILFALGMEVERRPFGRPMCSRVWNFDAECISETGDYVRIVKRLCQVAGQPDRLTDIRDFVDLDAGQAWLKYKIGNTERHWDVEVSDDWADQMTVNYVMEDLERDGRRFFYKDNGQAMVLYFLDKETASALNCLSNDALQPVIPT